MEKSENELVLVLRPPLPPNPLDIPWLDEEAFFRKVSCTREVGGERNTGSLLGGSFHGGRGTKKKKRKQALFFEAKIAQEGRSLGFERNLQDRRKETESGPFRCGSEYFHSQT